jgi:natural product precursor
MKQKKLSKKLSLNRKTIANLNSDAMDIIRGGTTSFTFFNCTGMNCTFTCDYMCTITP